MNKFTLSRRTLLRSAGVAVGLPLLDAMLPSWARRAAADPIPAPRRFVGIFGLPTGVLGKFDSAAGCFVAPWTQPGEGPLQADPYLQHFFEARIQNKVAVLTGLTDRAGYGNHKWAYGGFLTGTAPRFNRASGRPDIIDVFGPSADQIVANHTRQYTAIPSLALNPTKPTVELAAGPYTDHLSWKSGTEPVPNDQNPIEVFNRLFGSSNLTANTAEAMKRELYRKSVLDYVKADATSLKSTLGPGDRAKLDQYLESVRDLELRIRNSGAPSLCTPGLTPTGLPADLATNNAKVEVRLKLMMDLLIKAFECDRTRVASLGFTTAYGLFGAAYPHLNIRYQHHHWSHWDTFQSPDGVTNPDVNKGYVEKYTHWAFSMYAYLLEGLDKHSDVDGSTMLDNSLVYFSGENCDSKRHSNQSMPVILAGRGGKTASGAWAVRSGRHIRFQKWQDWYNYPASGAPWAPAEPWMASWHWNIPTPQRPGEKSVRDLLWTMIKLCGVPNVNQFGDATTLLNLA